MIRSLLWSIPVLLAAPAMAQDTPPAQTILFIGNSFTFGAKSPVWKYRAASVNDLNHDGVGGVPALFRLFTREAGLNYAVSLETAGGKSLGWHYDNRRALFDRAWDHVVLQEFSTLDADAPGNPARTIADVRRLAGLLTARNPKVEISLTATWSRPDLTYVPGGQWSGQPITRMGVDLRHGIDKAAMANPAVDRVNPVGEAFNCAIAAGVADGNPYDGVAFNQIDLWSYDQYHASAAGYYLEALTLFGSITGRDPRGLGAHETAAEELGIAPEDAVRLQRVAWATLQRLPCDHALAAGAEHR